MISSFQLRYAEKGVPEIQEYSNTQFSYKWFGLDFTGVGLPSLARRARVPVDSATLLIQTKFQSCTCRRKCEGRRGLEASLCLIITY